MSLIEGIGDEVTHFFIVLFAVIIVTFAWWTTNISEQRHVRTVLLLDRRRRGAPRLPRRLTNHTETVTISEGTSTVSEEVNNPEEVSSTPVALPSTSKASTSCEEIINNTEELEGEEQNTIIKTMDADQCVVRQRRLAFYENTVNSAESTGESSNTNNTTIQSVELPQNVESNVENIENPCDKITNHKSSNQKECKHGDQPEETLENQNEKSTDTSSIVIKLKYINEDLKIVHGNLEELLGDFKKRHFQPELTSNKIVRLIFNGQVLQQDQQTLQHCGFFDNCVVHCLIHQKRTSPNETQNTENAGNIPNDYFRDNPFMGVTNNNNQGRDWDLGNFLFALISFILLAAWYFRYVYAHLYTVTATVGLILITGIFTIVLVGMYFPDNEQLPNPHIRIARAERVDVQQ